MQRVLFFKSSTKTVETDCFIMTKKKLSHFLKKKKDYDPLEVVRKEKKLKIPHSRKDSMHSLPWFDSCKDSRTSVRN